LVAATVQEAMAKLGEMFRANMGYNPTHGVGSTTLHPLLTRQFWGMQNVDPGEKQQRALPVSVYHELHRMAKSNLSDINPMDHTIAWLQILAYFWCMRSCKSSDIQGEQRTKILCVKNIWFFNIKNRDISTYLDLFAEAVTVSITFEFQKKDVWNDMISHQRSGDKLEGGEMCPVRAAAEIIKQIYRYNLPEDKVMETPINYVEIAGKGFTISSSLILARIRLAVSNLGSVTLGFLANEVGTYSNHSEGVMGMFLAGTPVYTILLMGRWSSDLFMRYI
jgi:hypothetical protein